MRRNSSMFIIIAMVIALTSGCSNPASSTINSNQIISEKSNEKSDVQSIASSEPVLSSSIITSQDITKTVDSSPGKNLVVSFIDVGQADCILIQSPNGKNMLIDAGDSSSQSAISNYLKDKNINKIDVLVATHPHVDHIGSMAYVVNNYEIGSIYMPKAVHTTAVYETLLNTIKNKGLSINTAKAGGVITLGDESISINIVAPVGSTYSDLNSYSAVIKITYKNTSFLFAGDAGSDSEQEILNLGVDIKADVLKVGHHGSATSTSTAFLKAVSPEYAVISVGKGNTYGHPTQTALDRLTAASAKIYRTDDGGTVIVTSDGQSITINRNASIQVVKAPTASANPTSTVAPTTAIVSTAGDITVFKTTTGAKYHLDGCTYLSKSKIPIKLSAAKAEGLTACSKCNPPN